MCIEAWMAMATRMMCLSLLGVLAVVIPSSTTNVYVLHQALSLLASLPLPSQRSSGSSLRAGGHSVNLCELDIAIGVLIVALL